MIITGIERDPEMMELKARLLGSLLFFIQTFFKLRTGRDFVIHDTVGREPHIITMCRELTMVFNMETKRLTINIPPGHGKSTIVSYFMAWCMAHYPDCQFLYISYSHEQASKHTANIKSIMQMAMYKKLFGVEISKESAAKDDFMTIQGGRIKAFGSGGGITGHDAGLPNLDRFSGGVFMDDMHKPDEVHSDTTREGVITNYNETIKPRPRSPNVCMVAIGQRLHEIDLFGYLYEGGDGQLWRRIILRAIDGAGNILCPSLTPLDMLKREEEFNPYVYSAQYQQEPQPAGGGVFKPEWFFKTTHEPEMLVTFLTVDTAETTKTYNDASVFSFWGLHEIKHVGQGTDHYGLHWIDCAEIRVEAADLEAEFLAFYSCCMRYTVPPQFIAIEKKSTGVTLASTLGRMRGLQVKDIERTRASGSKSARYVEMQPYIAKKLISLPENAHHTSQCIEHCRKITLNNSHRHDDIADTLYDAIKIALMDRVIISQYSRQGSNTVVQGLISKFNKVQKLRLNAWQR